jgi:hypothetical protein
MRDLIGKQRIIKKKLKNENQNWIKKILMDKIQIKNKLRKR